MTDFCIANLEALSVWSFARTQEDANAALLNANTNGLYNEQGRYIITTYQAFQEAQRTKLLQPAEEVTEDKFYFALECLPPLNWNNTADGLNTFFMSEFWTASFTHQYATATIGTRQRYFKKMVDYVDKSTWMTLDELNGIVKAKRKARSEKFIKDNKEVLTKLVEEV